MNRIALPALLLLALSAQPAAAETTTAPAKAAATPKPPAAQELIYRGEATSILGREVRDPEARLVGRIVDVLVDDFGQPRAAIIDFGGFLGVGDRHIAVAWRALHFSTAAGHGTITLDMTLDQIKATPAFHRAAKPSAPPVVVAAPPMPKEPAAPAITPPVAPPASPATPPKPSVTPTTPPVTPPPSSGTTVAPTTPSVTTPATPPRAVSPSR